MLEPSLAGFIMNFDVAYAYLTQPDTGEDALDALD